MVRRRSCAWFCNLANASFWTLSGTPWSGLKSHRGLSDGTGGKYPGKVSAGGGTPPADDAGLDVACAGPTLGLGVFADLAPGDDGRTQLKERGGSSAVAAGKAFGS